MFMHEAGIKRFANEHGKQKAIELVGDINEYTRRYGPREPDGEPANAPSLIETRCLLDFNEHFIELSNGGEYLRSLFFSLLILALLMVGVPLFGALMITSTAPFDFVTVLAWIAPTGAIVLAFFLWPIVVSPAFFTMLRARYRFNRTTGKVYVLRPKRYGGNTVLDWDRVQAHVRWRGARRMTHDDLRNPTLRMIRQSDIESVALVLYWPPFDAGDPERKGEDILWVCPDVVTGEYYWQYIRTFMEEGIDAVPFPCEEDWLRKGFSSPGELMRENASSSMLVNVVGFLLWPVRSLAERLCYWPTFPEEWNSDCGQKRREDGIGPEEPLRWKATGNKSC